MFSRERVKEAQSPLLPPEEPGVPIQFFDWEPAVSLTHIPLRDFYRQAGIPASPTVFRGLPPPDPQYDHDVYIGPAEDQHFEDRPGPRPPQQQQQQQQQQQPIRYSLRPRREPPDRYGFQRGRTSLIESILGRPADAPVHQFLEDNGPDARRGRRRTRLDPSE